MYPILARYGPFFLYSFTIAMGLGLGAALALTAWLERLNHWDRPGWIDGLLISLVAALATGRIMFVLAHQEYFQENPNEAPLLWRGGLSYHGALLGGILMLAAWCKWRRLSFSNYAGLLAPGLALASVFGWLACWLDGCAYGKETVFGPLAADLPDSYGVFGLRYQSQLFGMILSGLALVLALGLHKRIAPGILFWLTVLALSSGRLATNFTRGDAMPTLASLRLDTISDAGLILVSIVAVIGLAGQGWVREPVKGIDNPEEDIT